VAEAEYTMSAKSYEMARWGMVGSVVVGILSMIFAFWTTVVSVTRPLGAITGTMLRLAKGERIESIPGAGRRDEV
jgi:hypothetical protein